jgi:hypothetical protein
MEMISSHWSDTVGGAAPHVLRSEDELILLCARVELRPEHLGRIGTLISSKSLDWSKVLEQSIRHGVAPLLARTLELAHANDRVLPATSDALATLAELRALSATRSQRLWFEMTEILNRLQQDGVPALALKDLSLMIDVYPEPGLRPIGDLDVLIHEQDYDAAVRAVEHLGFSPLPAAHAPYLRRYAVGRHFVRRRDDVWLDLQWNVAQREWDRYGDGQTTYDIARMWRRARWIDVESGAILVPSIEEMLLHLCVHLEGHEYAELILFCDVAEVLRVQGDQVDWSAFRAAVHDERAESTVREVFGMTARLLGVTIPDAAMPASQPYSTGDLTFPLFKNLAQIHHTLDEVLVRAAPPQPVLDEFERIARRQAVRAMRAFREMDMLAREISTRTGGIVTFAGQRPPRFFPDSALPAFAPLELLVEADSLVAITGALSDCEFSEHQRDVWMKRVQLNSHDPVLAGDGAHIDLQVYVGGADISNAGATSLTSAKRRSALRSVSGILRRKPTDDRGACLQVVARTMAPEEMVVWAAERLCAAPSGRLFRLRTLLAALSRLDHHAISDLDDVGERFDGVAGAGAAVRTAAALVEPEVASRLLQQHSVARARAISLLSAARPMGGRGSAFRSPYYWLLSLAQIESTRDRIRFCLSLARPRDTRSPLSAALADLGNAVWQRLWPRATSSPEALAYWAADEPIRPTASDAGAVHEFD